MTHKRVLGRIATLLCFLSLGAAGIAHDARGQGSFGFPEWMLVGTSSLVNNLYGANAIYFFNATHATLAYQGVLHYLGPGDPYGLKWDYANEPAGVSFIRQIRLIQGKLYAASAGTDVLVSSDSGETWTYSGLNLVNANDVYADGSGKIRMLQGPMRVFARLDTMHCIAQGIEQIFVSSDGGVTWTSTGVPMVDSSSLGAFADRCYNVYVCPNSWGTVFRSSDFGKTWQTVPTASGPGSEYLTGATTVVYLSSAAGMFRSINDGADWVSVITAQGYAAPLAVWGPMGEDVAGYGGWGASGGVCLTTTGGMDDLHGAPSMTDSNGAPLEQQDTMNVPLEMASTCQPFLIPITVESDVDSMTVRITLSDSLGDFALAASDSTVALRIHHEDTVWMQYDPHHSVSNAVLTFENHWNCSDWTETRTVHVDAIPSARISPPPMFAASCIPDTEAALIVADSCEVLCIDSVSIPPDLSQNFSVATPLPDTTSIGSNDSLLFAFTSTGSIDTIADSVIVYGHYLGTDSILNDYFYFPHASGIDTDFSFFYTSVPVILRSLPANGILSTASANLKLDTIFLCAERDTFAVFRNIGCDTVCVSNISLSGTGFEFPITEDSASLLRCLAPGARDTIWLATEADTMGHPSTNTDTLLVTSDANPPLAPIVLSRAIEYPAQWELLLSSPLEATAGTQVNYKILQSGQLPPIATSLDVTITYNDDVLGFEDTGDPRLTYSRTPDGLGHLHFHFAPVPSDSILDSVTFTAFVSRDTQTALSLDDIVLGNSQNVASDCLASITAAPSSFTLLPQCGTKSLTEFLRSGMVTIDNIDPNPAANEVTIGVYSGENTPIDGELSIVDALGRKVLGQQVTLNPGKHYVKLAVAQLPSGFYAVRLQALGSATLRPFVKK